MKLMLLLGILCLNATIIAALNGKAEAWDLIQNYNVSTHVFYGEITKVLPEPNFKTGVMGVRVRNINKNDLPLEPLIWPAAKELNFTVKEQFKESTAENFVAYLPDPDLSVWTYVVNQVGDVSLAKPEKPETLLRKLHSGDQGIFFIRMYAGSTLPIIYKASFGEQAANDLALLREFSKSQDQSLQSILNQARAEEAAAAAQETAQVRIFEDDYYKILRIADIEIRRSLLNDLTERMGFEGLWTYFDFKERYIKTHGAHTEDEQVPAGPIEGREKLWQNISAELKKIEVILNARAK